MANFRPLKEYMFYCLDRFIDTYKLQPPFLDAGCGVGDVSRYLAEKGWSGKAVDYSPEPIAQARERLLPFPQVIVEQKSFFDETARYNTVFLWDVLEHLEHDVPVLQQLASLLNEGGYFVLAVPSNPREWRWDDELAGHYRRYTTDEIREKMNLVGLESVEFWDFTYPLFWLLRRGYTSVKSYPAGFDRDKEVRTKASSVVSAWRMPVISGLLDRPNFIWRTTYGVQFRYFSRYVDKGYEFFALGRKRN